MQTMKTSAIDSIIFVFEPGRQLKGGTTIIE
jgi:hypothetical protein